MNYISVEGIDRDKKCVEIRDKAQKVSQGGPMIKMDYAQKKIAKKFRPQLRKLVGDKSGKNMDHASVVEGHVAVIAIEELRDDL